MSYNGSGTFLINTSGQPVVTGTTISSTVFNALTADLATGLSTAITKDGQTALTANLPMNGFKLTGLATGSSAGNSLRYEQLFTTSAVALLGALNWVKGADIASATTTDIGAATGNYVVVSGTTTITGLGTIQAGTLRIVEFSGILTLTYNATSLILPGAANITTAAGDTALFVSEGSGNWRCVSYVRASGSPLLASSKVVQVAQDVSLTSTLTVTGVGFRASSIDANAAKDSSSAASWGFAAGVGNEQCSYTASGNFQAPAGALLRYYDGANSNTYNLTAFTSDGATFSCTKVGTPTGTFQMQLKFNR